MSDTAGRILFIAVIGALVLGIVVLRLGEGGSRVNTDSSWLRR